eukprot:m.151933 g.151933  ORF g.151933 m.151933 type:complete len:306 (-) comp16350_c1_seq2:268-1185(-)
MANANQTPSDPTEGDDYLSLATPSATLAPSGGLFSPSASLAINPSNLAQAATFPSTGYSVPGLSLPAPDAASFSESFFAKFLQNEDLAFSALSETTPSTTQPTLAQPSTLGVASGPTSSSTAAFLDDSNSASVASTAAMATTSMTMPPDVSSAAFQATSAARTSSASTTKTKSRPNKQAADRYRKKKREEFEHLQVATEEMKASNLELKIKLAKLEDEAKFLSSLLVSTVQNAQSPLVTLQKLPDHLITDDMLPANVQAEDFVKYRAVIGSILQAQQRSETERLERLERQVAIAMQALEQPPTSS